MDQNTHSPRPLFALALRLLCVLGCAAPVHAQDEVSTALERAGANRPQIEQALKEAPSDQAPGMRWLVAHMPDEDLRSLESSFLLENCAEAYTAWRESPWREEVTGDLFFDAILPYASINEKRERWRSEFRTRFAPLVAEAQSISEAAAILNNRVFPAVGVKYSTQRKRADQGPLESIDSGLASCTGLSVLLIDACRSVGVPARFVGTPLWSDGSGNHSWVEIWDGGWHFTGAAEPTGMDLNKAWFTERASKAQREDPRNAIYAVTWRKTPIHFPLVWKPGDTSVSAVDVTDRYTAARRPVREGYARVRFRVLDPATQERVAVALTVLPADGGGAPVFEGTTRDERFDANDHVSAELPREAHFVLTAGTAERTVTIRFQVTDDESLVTVELPPL